MSNGATISEIHGRAVGIIVGDPTFLVRRACEETDGLAGDIAPFEAFNYLPDVDYVGNVEDGPAALIWGAWVLTLSNETVVGLDRFADEDAARRYMGEVAALVSAMENADTHHEALYQTQYNRREHP